MALRSAMREDPDVILVGEMRDYETISAVITLAETGHLVFSTLHTIGAAKTIDRIIDIFPQLNRLKLELNYQVFKCGNYTNFITSCKRNRTSCCGRNNAC